MMHASRARCAVIVALVAAVACSGSAVDGPPTVTSTPLTPTPGTTSLQPNLLVAAAGAPAIANPVVRFFARLGEDREAFMYYRPRSSGRDSTVFVRFRVPKRALLARPDGTPFAAGDSIQITISLVDPVHLEVGFEPSGLRFSATDPAQLKLSFLETDDDLNRDGRVDGSDTAIQSLLAAWRRESPTLPWTKQLTVVTIGSHEVETQVTGFTSYAIAW